MPDTTAVLQAVALDIAEHVIAICERYGLRYYLAEGSLLGAARHQGFIPWDDDMDLALPRADYDRLLQLLPLELPDGYRLVAFRTSEHHLRFFAQVERTSITVCEDHFVVPFVRGMWIDLFPIDGMPRNRVARWLHLKRLLWLRVSAQIAKADESINLDRSRPGLRRLFVRACMRCARLFHVSTRKRLIRYENAAKRYRAEETGWTVSIGSLYKGRTVLPLDCYGDGAVLPFMGRPWRVPAQYERVLTALYGDYRQLPPLERRVGHQLQILHTTTNGENQP